LNTKRKRKEKQNKKGKGNNNDSRKRKNQWQDFNILRPQRTRHQFPSSKVARQKKQLAVRLLKERECERRD
jgi:hypothetical protein